MKRASILFLRALSVIVGVAAVAWLLWEPHLEGRNVNADLETIYFHDPFLIYAYLGSLPFFFGLYRGFQLLGYVGRGEAISPDAVKALRQIKYCALALIGFIVAGETYIVLAIDDDHAGIVALGIAMTLACLVTAATAAILQRVLESAVDLKIDHDLTV